MQVERAQTRAIADALVWLSERAFDGHRSWAAAMDALEAQFDAEDSCLDTLLQVCVDAVNRFTHDASSIIMRMCVCSRVINVLAFMFPLRVCHALGRLEADR